MSAPAGSARIPRAMRRRGVGGGRVRLRTLIFIRWIAVVGQLSALLVVHAGLRFEVPLVPAVLVIGALALLNLVTAIRHRGTIWLDDRDARLYLAFDLAQLVVLLALTGGLQNPFSILILAPVVVSAAALSRASTVQLAAMAIVGISLLGLWQLPLPWQPPGLTLPPLYVAGTWGAMVLAVVFTAAYVSSLALESRRMADALNATQLALSREQRMSAMGGLAAAAAHELGSPLATIAVVARELEKDLAEGLPVDSGLREDLSLLRSESERCRKILANLASRPDEDEDSPYHRLPVTALVQAAAAPFARNGIELAVTRESPIAADEHEPVLPRHPELLHGLGTLIQNALQFARACVQVSTYWDEDVIRLTIHDDGPGFADTVLGDLGDPYVSTGEHDSREGEEHMGLGVFIAQTLLGRSGARLHFANRAGGGAEVVVEWSRQQFDAKGSSE